MLSKPFTRSHFFLGYGYFLWSIFLHRLRVRTGNFEPFTGSSWLWTQPSLVSFQWSGLSDQWTLFLTENCLWYIPEIVLLQGERSDFYTRLCWKGHSTSRQCSCHVHNTPCWSLSTSLYPTLFAIKWIAPTDNMWPKSDDTKWCHWWPRYWQLTKQA